MSQATARVKGSNATEGVAVVPSNTVNLTNPCDALYVGVAGDLKIITLRGTTTTLTAAANGYHPIGAKRVFDTGTTATNIVALYY